MTDKKEREYVCSYNHCLHNGEKVKASEAVVLNNKRYHMDCACMKQEIQDCVSTYMECIEDKTQYPMVVRTINTLVFKNQVPTDYIKKKIESSRLYYSDKPVYALYGIRTMFYNEMFKELKVGETVVSRQKSN